MKASYIDLKIQIHTVLEVGIYVNCFVTLLLLIIVRILERAHETKCEGGDFLSGMCC